MKRNWPLYLGVFLFGVFIIYRATTIPFTHDEASTYINYRHLNVWSCINNYSCWGSANNHWLNTLLLQWSACLFGENALALRLPNILAGIVYLIGASFLAGRYIKSVPLQIAGFALLVAHVYLLDFFSLARGYGLMACGVLWGIYALMRYIEDFQYRWLLLSVVSLFFAILSNFTALLPWAAVGMGWFLWVLIFNPDKLLLRHGMIWFSSAFILWILLRYPIKTLSGSGEFDWGVSGPFEMMKDLVHNLLYGARYFGESTVLYVLYGLTFLLGALLVLVFVLKKIENKKQLYLSFLLLVLNFLVIFLQQKITGSQAPVGRKTLYLIPFLLFPLVLGLGMIRHQIIGLGISFVIVFSLLFHIKRAYPWTACREWYYDAFYPELFSALLPSGAASDSIQLGSSWIFIPSLRFYQNTASLPLSGLEYLKPLVIDTTMQYYYVETPDTSGMYAKGFILNKNIGPFFLFKNEATTNPGPEIHQEE